ncbi:MAG: response regulator [Planctomyces sp.]|nr:response regulator [Planctomyces sp.]
MRNPIRFSEVGRGLTGTLTPRNPFAMQINCLPSNRNSLPDGSLVQSDFLQIGELNSCAEALEANFDPCSAAGSDKVKVRLQLLTSIRMMKADGGEISAKNAPGSVPESKVRIPVAQVPDIVIAGQRSEPKSSRCHVLLLDDDPLVLRSIGLLIQSLGHTVVQATNGEEALDVAMQHREQQKVIDVAILDLTIRDGRGGLEILEELKQILPQTACIASSGYSDSPAMTQHRELGFHGILAKPFTRASLEQVLRTVCLR